MRDGDDNERVAKGGARHVHGLQGTGKGNILPANAPPYEAWFIDEDGLDQADVYGEVGGIAIFEPCDTPAVAEPAEPVEPAPYPLPTPPGPGIWIKKQCAPAAFGGHIHCTITVTNSGDTLPDVPVTIFDAATILAGPGAGGAVIIAAAAPDVPQWVCSATPTPDLTCTLPPDLLPPGASHSVDVTVDTGPLLAAGNHGFRNCASLAAPWSGVACDEGGTNIVVIKTAPAACAPGADCTFGMTITNTGSQPFDGDLLVSDSMFMGPAAPLPAPITAIVPALGCAPAPAALPFSCVAPMTLAPGESKAFAITATMPVGPPGGYWARNCFATSAPGLPPPALPPPAGGSDTAVSCAWMPVGAPAALSNLKIEKTALHAAKCAKMPGDVILCSYEIDLVNDGPSPFHDVITFNETVPPAATLTVGSPAWACAGAAPVYACHPNPLAPVDIPAGATITIPVEISIPLAPLEAAGCGLPNTVAITAPPAGAGDNFDGGDDTAAAVADAFLSWVDGFGVTHVTCDPSNLKTAKAAKGACVAAGSGYLCSYTASVTNTGPDPYHGPIKVSEQLGFAPASVSFSPPWACAGSGAGYQCTLPHADLEKGDSVTLEVSVGVAGERQCEMTNRIATTFPVAGTRFNNKSGDDFAAATSKIPAKRCEKPDRQQCKPGANELRTESGACVCKTGFIRDDESNCVSIIEPARCPDGTPVPKSGRCPPPPSPACEPGPNEFRNDAGQCVCKRGYERNEDGRCVRPKPTCEPGPNEFRNDSGQCVCKRGYERDENDRCVPPRPRCEPGPNEFRNDSGQCVCKRGYERDKNDRCVPPRPTCEPGPNEFRNDSGQCVCKRGYERDKNDRCVPPRPTCEPGPNEFRNDAGQCVCKRGFERDKIGRCVTVPNPAEECRKKGWKWDGKHCVEPSNAAEDCKKKGWNWDGKHCVEPRKKTCPAGFIGTPPNCKPFVILKCPRGTVGIFPNCKKR